MPGFAAYAPIQMWGNDILAFASTNLSCDALAGWMQAGDWRLDAEALSPLPSATPAPGGITFPRIRWLALSRLADSAIVKLAATAGDSGCDAKISRLSRQPFEATGAFASSTSALAYQLVCSPIAQEVTVGSYLFGDDGSRAFLTAKVPLVLGTHPLLDGSLAMGKSDFSPAKLAEALASGAIGQAGSDRTLGGLTTYTALPDATGTATVTSIDPFLATVEFTGLQDPKGGRQALTAGMRCDMSSGILTQAALAPVATPSPTPAPAGHLEVTVGTGPKAFSRILDGPEVTCSFGILAKDTWDLQYSTADASGLVLSLYIPPKGEPSLLIFEGTISIQIEAARVGGTLSATVDDRGTEVAFTARGKTPDGRPARLSATCGAITRP
jgi:hypothetical protein